MHSLSDDNLEHLKGILAKPEFVSTRYEIKRKLGSGGMADVYLGRDRELDRMVAIKVISIANLSPEMTERLLREAQIIAKLEHPGIVPIHDVGTLSDNRVFYVMKYVEGVTLEEFAQKTTQRSDLLRIFLKVCDAISFAHARGIIHRDIKPSNIMIGSYGEALVMDWGIASRAYSERSQTSDTSPEGTDAQVPITAHGTILGTLCYMSPEQAAGDPRKISLQSDVYSLGAVLYYMLTRQAPYPTTTSEETRRAVLEGIFPEPREIEKQTPKALNAICLKAMSRLPDDRYHDCAELSADISSLLDQLPVKAYKENIIERLARWIVRNKIIVLIVIGYMLVRFLIFLRIGF